MMPFVERNDCAGCWAFGVSKDGSVGLFSIHFAVWHVWWHIKGKGERQD